MILTKRFVYIHVPKTGGTFVTSVLERLMKPEKPRNVVEFLGQAWEGAYRDTDKHAAGSRIPASHRGLPVIATIRNPFDRYVSQFAFSWWKNEPRPWTRAWWKNQPMSWSAKRRARRLFPHFPDLTFDEFVEYHSVHSLRFGNSPLPVGDRLGAQSERLVRDCFKNPESTWGRIDDAYIAERRWEADLLPVTFLRQESLNRDLYAFLLRIGFPEAEIAFIRDEARILPPGPKRDQARPWSDWYSKELRAKVRRRERLIFAMFPQYDV